MMILYIHLDDTREDSTNQRFYSRFYEYDDFSKKDLKQVKSNYIMKVNQQM